VSKINIFKRKLKKLLSVIAVFCLLAISSQIQTYLHIPLKGLFEVLKYDDIGFAHALLHSGWVENVYQYGSGKPHRVVTIGNREQWKCEKKSDAVANLVRKFWFRKSENHQLLPTKFNCLANIPNARLGKVFGKLINYVYTGLSYEQYEQELIDEFLKYDPEYEEYRQELTVLWREVIDEGYRLEDKKFNELKKAKKLEQEKIKELKKEYKIMELNERIARASKKWGKKKGFSKKRKEILRSFGSAQAPLEKLGTQQDDRGFDIAEYHRKLQEARERVFSSISKEIQDEYCKILGTVKKMKANIDKKVNKKRNIIKKELFEFLAKALEFCKTKNTYLPRMTESIVWALFFHKLDDLTSLEEKIIAINDCLQVIDNEYKNELFQDNKILTDLYTPEELYDLKKDIQKLDAKRQITNMVDNYDVVLHFVIDKLVDKKFPPSVSQGSFGYEYEKGRITHTLANCYETAMHDLFSILWYNPKKKYFDNNLFDQEVIRNGKGFAKFRQALRSLCFAGQNNIESGRYTSQDGGEKFVSFMTLDDIIKKEAKAKEVAQIDEKDISVQLINNSEVQQAFMNIVSNIPRIIYDSDYDDKKFEFELRPSVQNFIALCNYFYGTKAITVQELGIDLSTADREIEFEHLEGNDLEQIKITVRDKKNKAYFDMTVNIEPKRHAYITVDGRKKTVSKIFKKEAIKKLLGSLHNFRDVTLFVLLTSQKFLEKEEFICDSSILYLMYYSYTMRNPQVKLEIIKDVLQRPFEHYENCKSMIHNLLETFPLDDVSLTRKLIDAIGEALSLKRSKYFSKYLFGVVLSGALKKGYIGFVFSIINNPKFNLETYHWGITQQFGSFLLLALKNKAYEKVASKILEIAPCWLLEKAGYAGIYDKEDEALVLKIVRDAKFDSPCSGDSSCLWFAIKYGYKQVIDAIIKKPGFKNYGADELFLLVMKKGYGEIAAAIFKQMKYKINENKINKSLLLAIEKGCKEVAFIILNIPEVHFARYTLACALKMAIEKEHKKIALAIVKHPRFKPVTIDNNGECICTLLFEKDYREIILAIVKNSKLYVSKKDNIGLVLYLLLFFLKKGCRDIVLQILNHALFDSLIEGILDFIKKYERNIDEEHMQEKQEIIKILKNKQSEKRKLEEKM